MVLVKSQILSPWCHY